MGWLSELPVSFNTKAAISVESHFLQQRNDVSFLEQFRDFIDRWKALWYEMESDFFEVDIDIFKVFLRLRLDNRRGTFNPDDPIMSKVVEFLVPTRLLEVHLIAAKYGVPFNVALVQRFADDEDREKAF